MKVYKYKDGYLLSNREIKSLELKSIHELFKLKKYFDCNWWIKYGMRYERNDGKLEKLMKGKRKFRLFSDIDDKNLESKLYVLDTIKEFKHFNVPKDRIVKYKDFKVIKKNINGGNINSDSDIVINIPSYNTIDKVTSIDKKGKRVDKRIIALNRFLNNSINNN